MITEKSTPQEIVASYLERGLKIVTWPAVGEAKGPSGLDAVGWLDREYTLDDYHEGYRVGLMHGVEITPGRYVVDVDIDYGPGVNIALAMLPMTQFVWGRASKKVSHCLYTCPDVIPMYAYKDVGKDGVTLIEFRADKHQSMAPPSVWEKDGKREQLKFVHSESLTFVQSASELKQRVCLSAIGMLLAKHLGHNGFGHQVRLAWAGFLLRCGIGVDDLITMGEAISQACNNREVEDVKRVLLSTQQNLGRDARKVQGGPALAKLLGEHGRAIINRINEWIGRDSDFKRNKDGAIIARSQENIMRAIETLGHELSYNEFSDKMLMDRRPLEDPQWIPLCLEIEREFHFSPPVEYFKMVIKDLAWKNGFHPVKDYLDSLKWDGVPRINTWLITAARAPDSKYVQAISAIMLIAAVRRIYHPGAKYDEMVLWESPQGSNKSSAAQALCPNPDWFSDDLRLNLHSQQLIEATLGKWIIEASDLAGKRKTEIEQLKAMLSRQVDGPARMAYAHFPVERPRHFIIIGTTNSSSYLTDQTGGRRFWPMKVGRFDVDWIKANRDQLWAEAVVRERAGESIRLEEELWPFAGEEQEKRREVDPWEDVLRRKLLETDSSGDGRRRIITTALWDALNIPLERRDRTASLRISEIMQRLGFERTRVRAPHGLVEVGYIQRDKHKLELQEGEMYEGSPAQDEAPF